MIAICHCRHCNGRIEFDPDEYQIHGVGPECGKEVVCSGCGQPTLAFIPYRPAVSRSRFSTKWIKWIVLGALVLTAGVCLIVGPENALNAAAFVSGSIIYFIPSMLAYGKRNFTAILLLNIFLGWTFIGWVVALVWAATKDKA